MPKPSQATDRPIRVAIVVEHALTRAGLRHMVTSAPPPGTDHPVFTECSDPGDCDVAVYDQARLLAATTGGLDGRPDAGASIVVVAVDGRRDLSLAARELGAVGVVAMDVTAAELLEMLNDAATSGASATGGERESLRAAMMTDTGLTGRELEMLERIAAGMTNGEIAEDLYLSINSVKTYVRTAYRKIGVSNRATAVLWSADRGLI